MRYIIYCNQKTISQNHQQAISEFEKRLHAYCDITTIYDTSLYLPKKITNPTHRVIQIQDGPSTYTSEEFANYIQTLQLHAYSTVHILIGYTEATLYSQDCILANPIPIDSISLSRTSLSTQTKTLLFYEQLYRGYTILQGKTYHK